MQSNTESRQYIIDSLTGVACRNAYTWLHRYAKTWQCGIHNSNCGETYSSAVIIHESTTCLCRNKGTTANATNTLKYAWRDSVAIVQHNKQLITLTPRATEALVTCHSQTEINQRCTCRNTHDTFAVQRLRTVSSRQTGSQRAENEELNASRCLNQCNESRRPSTQLQTVDYFLECWSVLAPLLTTTTRTIILAYHWRIENYVICLHQLIFCIYKYYCITYVLYATAASNICNFSHYFQLAYPATQRPFTNALGICSFRLRRSTNHLLTSSICFQLNDHGWIYQLSA